MTHQPSSDERLAVAKNLEHYLVPTIFRPWAEDLLNHISPQQGEHVLDIACGTGVAARLVAESVGISGTVIGLDNSEEALEVARKHALAENIQWQRGDAVNLPFLDAQFDIVLCQQGLQFFRDKQTALREMQRVLKYDGRIAVSVWSSIRNSPGYFAIQEALLETAPDVAKGMSPGFSLDDAEQLQTLLLDCGCNNVRVYTTTKDAHFVSAEAWVHQWESCSVRMRALNRARPKEAVEADRAKLIVGVKTRLQDYESSKGLIFPMEVHIAVASK